jgi:serine/threonine-protein kinase
MPISREFLDFGCWARACAVEFLQMSSVKPGDVLAGKYRVERVLGSGGMGYVVAARHLQLDQLVAMKFLRGGAQLDETEATGRFLREAKAVVRLRDEHVAKVFDVGTLESGEPYIVMEYLDGCDLSALAKQRGQIPASEAVEYVMQACEALAEAHSIGIVHRDVKLANLFLTRGHAGSPLVKVLDFGISKMNPFGESDHEMTRTASMLGSPRFMSPEQMRDPRNVDARSDIWSLGVVLYRLVAGKAPFEAETLGRLLSMVMHEHPDPLAAIVDPTHLPLGFSETVHHCLEKDANNRFSNIAELAYALAPFAVDPIRARAGADRIAATLSVAQLPRAMELPSLVGVGMMSVPAPGHSQSNPPGSNDTGTAAPWAGTHGGRRLDPARASLVWAAVALAATLVAGGAFAWARHEHAVAGDRSSPSAGRGAAASQGVMSEVQTGTTTAATPPDEAPPMVPMAGQVTAASPMPTTTATNDPVGSIARPPSTGSEPSPRRPPPPPPPPRKQPRAQPASAGGSTPAAAPQSGGIPATRD